MGEEGDRLARVETAVAELSRQVEAARRELADKIDGGPSMPWERSVRGRLHTLEAESSASKAASHALTEAQRIRRETLAERRDDRRDRIKLRVQTLGVVVAAIAVGVPWIERLWP